MNLDDIIALILSLNKMTKSENDNVTENQSNSLKEYLRNKRNPLIVSVIGFILGIMIWGTVSSLIQESLKRHLFSGNTRIRRQLLSSSLGIFQNDRSEKVTQILTYEVVVSDLTRDIKVTATFSRSTQIVDCYVDYSVDVEGFKSKQIQNNHVELTLTHPLDVSKRAYVYILTERKYVSSEDKELEIPDIHVEGKNKNGEIIYE